MIDNWKEYFVSRRISAKEAVDMIQSGDTIVEGQGLGRSEIFMEPMLERADELKNVNIVCASHRGREDYCDPKYEGIFNVHSFFLNPGINGSKDAVWQGRAEYYPVPFYRQAAAMKKMDPDIFFVQTTAPNSDGYVSLGVSVDYCADVMKFAKKIIAHVNPAMPWTEGDGIFPVTDIDYFVQHEIPITELVVSEVLSDTDTKIAEYVASLVHDGDTLQIGTGSVPDKVMKLLSNHKHLGIHSEMGSMGLMRLMQSGVIDNTCKTLDRGYSVFSLLAGFQELYDYVDHNPDIIMKPASYVTNPMVIAQQKNFVAINSAIQVDLLGQIVADMIGPKQYSGVGGQLDFMRGADLSEGGRAIICMPSTAAKGKVSRIVPFISNGAAVSDTRYDAMYIITEYGIADLWGKSTSERAKALIEIAHPDFRADLEEAFEKQIRKIV